MTFNSTSNSTEKSIKVNPSGSQDLVLMMTKSAHRGYRKIFKDIEISKLNILLLTAITFGVTCLISVSIFFTVDAFERDQFLGGTGVVFGLISGILMGGLIVDRIERKFPILTALLGMSPLFCIWGFYAKSSPDLFYANILLSLNLAIGIFLIILLLTMYIQYTTMLERGRIIAIILSTNSILSIGLIFLMFHGYYVLIPAVFPLFVAIWLYKHRTEEKATGQVTILEKDKKIQHKVPNDEQNPEKKETKNGIKTGSRTEDNMFVRDVNNILNEVKELIKEKRGEGVFLHFLRENGILIKYLIAIFIYGIIVGLLIPFDNVLDEILLANVQSDNLLFIGIYSTLFIIIGTFLIGMVFDFYGRKPTLSFIILLIGLVNFSSGVFDIIDLLENVSIPIHENYAILIASAFILFLSIPLLNGDLSRTEFYGRTNGLWILSAALGILLGVIYKSRIAESLVLEFTTRLNMSSDITIILLESSISSIVFIGCIGVLFILANISQDLSKDEQNWPDALIHMYIIHNSGLLLYEHSFRNEKGLATADLVSGGIIGLVSMLKEITQGNQNLRIIDHGDKKLLFQWDREEKVVFVFVIERELVIIRNKLNQFINEFDDQYEKYLKQFNGVDDSVWNSVKFLVEKHFTRRYLTIIPGTEHFISHTLD